MKRQRTLGLVITIIAIGIVTIPLSQNVQAQSLVPDWIKNNAGWWAEGTIDDKTFLDGIEFLIENKIINVSSKSIDVDTITIGFIPVEKADELTPKAQALEQFLENKLGVDVELVVPTNYDTIIEGMRFGHI
ncbi:MAG: PhnD/SsuA/transferrin family substrate-binding protein, partial [Nitrosopumilus sp.]